MILSTSKNVSQATSVASQEVENVIKVPDSSTNNTPVILTATTLSFTDESTPHHKQDRPVKSQSLPLPLPTPVPCTEALISSAYITRATATSLTYQGQCQVSAVSARYPHLTLPLSTPPYLFSDDMFTPNVILLAQLMDMGVVEKAATKALYWTGNSCIERASNWVFERPEESLKTPLEVEIKMLRADLDIKEEEIRERVLSIDSGVQMMDDDEMEFLDLEQMEEMSDMSEDYELYKLVLVINKSHLLSPGEMTKLVGKAAAHMLAKVAMIEFGDEQLEMWEACCQQVVVIEGNNTMHLLDLRLAADCLGLEWVEEGDLWDRVNRRYREVAVLGIWGDENTLHSVVGRLKEAE